MAGVISVGGSAVRLRDATRNHQRTSRWKSRFLVIWLSAGTFLYKTLLFMGSTYGILWLAFAPALTRFAWEPRADLSYGTYLYGWPIQQSLHALWPGVAAGALLVPSLAITLLVAAVSWYLIEKPALGLKARALGRRTLRTIEPAAP